jgi:putative membrane protein
MKTCIIFTAWLCTAIISCNGNSNSDSKEAATDQNEKKFDNSSLEKDADFAVKAADGGLLEVQLGNLALTNASSPEVKQFGQMMIDDHSKANQELQKLAASKNITIPAVLSSKAQKMMDDLSQKKGSAFDEDYISMMVEDHEEDIKEFKREVDQGKDAEMKAWAASKISILEHHLSVAKDAKEHVKNKQ